MQKKPDILYYFLTILGLAFSFTSPAQRFNFKNIKSTDGLLQPQILCIEQDHLGRLYMGTNGGGINIYDGKNFTYINSKNGLVDDVVYSIKTISKNQLIVGTSNGLSVINGNKINNYTTVEGLTSNRIFNLTHYKNSFLIATGSGISEYENGKVKPFKVSTEIDTLPIFNICKTNSYIWFCTLGGGIYRYDGQKADKFNKSNGLVNQYVYNICEIEKDIYFILTDQGLFQLKNNTITEITPDNNKAFSYEYHDFCFDYKNQLWLATSAGLFKYVNNTFTKYSTKNGLTENNVWKIFSDRESNLWFCYNEGGTSVLSGETFYYLSANEGISDKIIYSLLQTPDRDIYLGTTSGLVKLDKNKAVKTYSIKQGLASGTIYSMHYSSANSQLYIATNYGISILKNDNITSYEIKNESQKVYNNINHITVDKQGTMWLSTNGGIAQFINNQIVPYNNIVLPQKVAFQVLQDKSGIYWIATYEGVVRFDGDKQSFFGVEEGFTNKRVDVIYEDTDGNIWLGTGEGIFVYRNSRFSKITAEGISATDLVNAIIQDKNGYIWVSHNNGLDKIKLDNNGVVTEHRHFDAEDGFTSKECNDRSILCDAENHIWIGTSDGIIVCQPEYDKQNLLEPTTLIRQVKLFNQPTDWKLHCDSVGNDNLPISLELSYEKNYISFDFIGVSHTTPGKVTYKYQLKGLDKDWIITQKNEALYSGLPPGKYEFQVMAQNGEGIWNQQPTTFRFIISPPFHKTWWFYSLVILIILSGIYSYITIRASNKKILKQNEIIENANEHLELANEEIAQKNKNITDSINYAKRIQDAILPPDELIKKSLPDSFVLYKPKDIVSGDFYWFTTPNTNAGTPLPTTPDSYRDQLPTIFLAACDCTGHGVPGALVSMVGHNGLERAVNEFGLREPGHILDKLNQLVEETLRQKDGTEVKDGMDVALISLEYLVRLPADALALQQQAGSLERNIVLKYAGANNPIWIVRKKGGAQLPEEYKDNSLENTEYDLYEIKADKQPIGIFEYRKNFKTHTLQLQKGDSIYLFSDGYADQFGGAKGKKFLYKPFKKLLLKTQNQSMEDQKLTLDYTIEGWKGALEQVDDILVIGVRI